MIVIIVLVILLSEFTISSTEQNTLRYDVKCTKNGKYTPNSLYQFSLYNLLGNLTLEASQWGYYNASFGQSPHQVFGFYLCRGDTDSEACRSCVDAAKNTILKKCPYQTGALIWYPQCMIRFSNESFFGKMDVVPDGLLKKPQNITGDQTSRFATIVGDTMNNLAVQAASGKEGQHKFATKEVNVTGFSFRNLYALAQCTPDLTRNDCHSCLRSAIRKMYGIVGAAGARVVQPSCCVRYEIYRFFNWTTNSSLLLATPNSNGMNLETSIQNTGRRKHYVLHVSVFICTSITITILVGVGIWTCIHKQKAKAARTSNSAEINEIKTVDSLQFDLSTIKAATRNFSADNKLGEGGFGEVYKGILEHGQEVAIKRLSKDSGQGIEEFKTEVVLVAKLQHKNLVKLLGFCFTSTEKILVYEFMRNSSLDQYLFDATKKASLDWETRLKLIVGIARGLLYLHEDSRLKVIHRDLKPSNILLDEGMNPKISDFGLAKLFGVDQTQDNTKRIVGTYGYMAPEYAMTGHFSAKSDVYSFGIIILEIVSGQRNRFFGRHQVQEALLHRAWRYWNEGKALYLVDTALANKYPKEEVMKCIHTALLCIQENAAERPRMATVAAALNGQSISLPMPKAPNFFGNTSGNEVEYHQELDQECCSFVYTGTDITEMYPR